VTIYLSLVEDYDREEYLRAGGEEPSPRSKVLIRFESRPPDEAGFYMPDDGELPRIFVYRSGFAEDPLHRAIDVARAATDPLGELIALSHELGHHELVLRGHGTGIFDRDRPIESYTEEAGAWFLARELLAKRGFVDWTEFDRRAEHSLKTYEEGLGLASDVTGAIRERSKALLTAAG